MRNQGRCDEVRHRQRGGQAVRDDARRRDLDELAQSIEHARAATEYFAQLDNEDLLAMFKHIEMRVQVGAIMGGDGRIPLGRGMGIVNPDHNSMIAGLHIPSMLRTRGRRAGMSQPTEFLMFRSGADELSGANSFLKKGAKSELDNWGGDSQASGAQHV